MDAETLALSQPGLALDRAKQLVQLCNDAMMRAECINERRAAMFLAQIGHESSSLAFQEELGPLRVWDTYGGGPEYHGRTFIQVTHDTNYRKFGQWCVTQKLLKDGEHFVKHPERLADDQWAWLGPVWYWTVERSNLNALSDDADMEGATRAINGGLNHLQERKDRYENCLSLGRSIMPTAAHKLSDDDEGGVAIIFAFQDKAWITDPWYRARTELVDDAAVKEWKAEMNKLGVKVIGRPVAPKQAARIPVSKG